MTAANTVSGPRTLAQTNAWLAGWSEAILEPGLRIIDAHHHMWIRPPERFSHDELMSELRSGHNVVATVFMECTAMFKAGGPVAFRPVGETEYVNGVAAMSASGLYGPQRLCAGIVGYADLTQGEAVRAVLEAHVRAGGGRFRGIRHQAQYDPVLGSMARRAAPPGLLLDPAFRRGFAQLAPLGLGFDAWVFFTQLGEVADLADAFPETSVVLNHSGGPLGVGPYATDREAVFARWSQGMRDLGSRPNVTVKIGGMGMTSYGFGFHERRRPPSSEDLAAAWRPYVTTCIEAFGPQRCMFESNFPVDKSSYAYPILWNAFKRLAAGASAGEKRWLFSDTAEQIYRLDL